MIELYGKTYAKNDREFTSSLFNKGGTANGFYRVAKAGIYLSDMQGNERAFVRHDGLGPVTVTRREDGKRFYMFAVATADKAWLNVPESYMEEVEGAKALADSIFKERIIS